MRRLRHILSLLITLTFMVGVTVQAAHVDRMGSMPERVDTAMHMDQAGSDGCPDCDMGKAAMQGAACQSVCIAMPIALPETPGVLAMAHADPVPRQPTPGSGMIRSPDPHPPRSGLRA